MNKVYAITKKTETAGGHGSPGSPYLSLASDGECFKLGNPLPVFTSKECAELKMIEFDTFGFYEITELEVI